MAAIETAERLELIYSATIGGDREGEETTDLDELLEVIRTHLDAAEQSGRKIRVDITLI